MSAIAIGVGGVAGLAAGAAGLTAATAATIGVGAAGVAAAGMGASKGAAASRAAAAQQAAGQKNAIATQNAQFQQIQELLAPYVQAGQPNLTQPYVQAGPGALQGMQALAGLGGEAERQRALYQLQQSPQFTSIADVTKGNLEDYLRQRQVELKAFQKTKEYAKAPVAKGQNRKDVQADLLAQFNRQTEAGTRDIEAQAYAQRQALMQPVLSDESYAQIGAERQRQAIQGIEQGPQFQELLRQGEQGILQNASATGGLRGGNVQGALAQFRPSLLNQLIEAQYGKLAGLTTLGSSSAQNLLNTGASAAAGTATAGQASAQNIGNLQTGIGAAQAGGTIGAANAYSQGMSGAVGSIGGGLQNYMLMQQLNKPTVASGIGTGGFAGSYQQAQQMYGGAPVAYFAPEGPGGPGGWYKQS
jgi:hypothetical protein